MHLSMVSIIMKPLNNLLINMQHQLSIIYVTFARFTNTYYIDEHVQKNNNQTICQFHYPLPPMTYTKILKPFKGTIQSSKAKNSIRFYK